jgi:signal transduction histidine kinase
VKTVCTLLLVGWWHLTATCQVVADSSNQWEGPIDVATVYDSTVVVKKTLLFLDSNRVAQPDNLLQQHFVPLSNFSPRKNIPVHLVNRRAYLQYQFTNSGNKALTVYVLPGQLFKTIKAYQTKGGNMLQPLPDEASDGGHTRLTVGANEQVILIQELFFCKKPENYLSSQVISERYLDTYEKAGYHDEILLRITGFVLSGILLMMILFMAANFFLTWKKEFLYNCLYSICMFGLMFLFPLHKNTYTSFYAFYISYFDFFLLVVGTIFYIAFTRQFLEAKSHYPLLEKLFRKGEMGLFILLLVFSYVHFFTDHFWLENALENSMKIVTLLLGVVYIFIALQQRNRLMNYLAAGNAVLILFSLVSFTMIQLKGKGSYNTIFKSAYFYYSVGIVLEIVFFMLGLIYKNRMELIATTKQREALKLEAEKKEFEARLAVIKAQQEERNRISADMHDDLGSGMTAIRLYSELAKKKVNAAQVPEIEKISSFSNELLNKMNAIIWTMSSSNDSLGNLIAYIRSYALEYFEGSGIDCRITMPENVAQVEVQGEKRRNIFLTVKETLNNIMKHSKATKVHIEFKPVESGLLLLIQDNGIGINTDNLREFGNGLKNMKKRMESSGCEFSIENNEGTLVRLTCSL